MGNSCFACASPALVKTNDPAFEWKIYGFPYVFERGAISVCSASFPSCGYEWYLQLSPMHKNHGVGIPYVALSLSLRRSSLKPDYILNAVFELSMYNHSKGTYRGCKATYNFHVKNAHSEKKCLIPLDELLKSSDFLVDDSCVFGVRILRADVISPKMTSAVFPKNQITVQNLFLQKKEFIKGTYTWTINNFIGSKLEICSPVFEVGGHNWYINMHPLGDQYSTKSLSLYLHLHDPSMLPSESGMMIEATLSIVNQTSAKNNIKTGRLPFAGKNGWGWSNFIPLKTLNDPSKGYLVGSNCIVKADITIIGSSNNG
ncbi:hypothetical protein EJB05_21974 [Eragrostis curvula]|uniref:MATH domain-containing protein n=1 Tax=Eragrostis curvula TaxID=38414 RepID=A0A5J9V4D1_9POAL|nr:hypothetical protein EJB05_21974 [Eragrostis curvula]